MVSRQWFPGIVGVLKKSAAYSCDGNATGHSQNPLLRRCLSFILVSFVVPWARFDAAFAEDVGTSETTTRHFFLDFVVCVT